MPWLQGETKMSPRASGARRRLRVRERVSRCVAAHLVLRAKAKIGLPLSACRQANRAMNMLLQLLREHPEQGDIVSWMPDLPESLNWDTFFGKADGACIPPGSELILLELSGSGRPAVCKGA